MAKYREQGHLDGGLGGCLENWPNSQFLKAIRNPLNRTIEIRYTLRTVNHRKNMKTRLKPSGGEVTAEAH